MELLRTKWRKVCDEYLKEFCEKNDFDYLGTYWVGDDRGGIAVLGDVFVDMSTIRYSIDYDIEPKKFDDWYERSLEYGMLGLKFLTFEQFCKGVPEPRTNDELFAIKEAKKRVEEAQKALEELVNKEKKLEEF